MTIYNKLTPTLVIVEPIINIALREDTQSWHMARIIISLKQCQLGIDHLEKIVLT
jgi:hypothetical protein